MTAVCSVGLDMIAIPGDTPAETIAAIIADEMAIGVINDKTTGVRLIPVPGAKAGRQGRVRRPLRLGHRHGGAEHRGVGCVRPLRRPHPRTDPVIEELRQPMTEPLRWGILGLGGIARRFAEGLAHSHTGRLLAVASRTREKAEAFGRECGAARRYGSYEDLLADADVQAVYIATPHPMHAEWAIRAAAAGKHILCEHGHREDPAARQG